MLSGSVPVPFAERASHAYIDQALWFGGCVAGVERIREVVHAFLQRDRAPVHERRRINPCFHRHAARQVERRGRGNGHHVVDAVEQQRAAVSACRAPRRPGNRPVQAADGGPKHAAHSVIERPGGDRPCRRWCCGRCVRDRSDHHVIEAGCGQAGTRVAGHREADVDVRSHRHAAGSHIGPGHAVGREGSCQRGSQAGQSQPVRHGSRGAHPGGQCPGGCPLLEHQPVRRRREKGRVCGTCRQRGADHHPALGPPIGIREPRHPRRDLAIAGQPLVHELKTVGRGPDVGALAGNGDAAGLARGCGAFHRDRSNRCRRPSLWTGFCGGAPENHRHGNKRARLQSPLEHTPLPGPHGAVLNNQDW